MGIDGGYCVKCNTVWASPGKCRCDVRMYDAVWNEAVDRCIGLLQEERRISSHNKEILIYKMKEARK